MDKTGRKIRSLLILSLCVLMMVCMMTGCRKSPALIDNIYTKDATEVDPEQLMSSADQSDEPGDLETEQDPENRQNKQEQEKTASVQNDQSNNQNASKEIQDGNRTLDLKSATENMSDEENSGNEPTGGSGTKNGRGATGETGIGGEGESSDNNAGSTPGESEKTIDNNVSDNEDTQAEQNGESENNGEPESPEDNPYSGGDGNEAPSKWDVPRKTVTDGTGIEQNIPRDVYTVTAVGAAAPIVEMLGGSGRLLASSASFTYGNLSNLICQDVINGSVQTWWSEDGSDPISNENFQLLLDTRWQPDVCFVVNGQTTFTTDQLVQLQEAGIGYVALPELNSLENIQSAVNIVAATLESNATTHEAAKDIARDYSVWVEHIISEVKTDTLSGTIVISGWDGLAEVQSYAELGTGMELVDLSDVVTDLYPDVGDYDKLREDGYWTLDRRAVGVAFGMTREMQNDIPLFQCLSAAGIVTPNIKYNSDSYIPYVPGSDKKYQYFIPTSVPFDPYTGVDERTGIRAGMWIYRNGESISLLNDFSGRALYNVTTEIFIDPYRQNPYIELGDAEYTALIAETEEVKSAIESSPMWNIIVDAYMDMASDSVSGIGGPYTIYVNPKGFDSWIHGGVDCPLEAIWAACKISGTISESKLRSEVESFYSRFFGVVPDYNSVMVQ